MGKKIFVVSGVASKPSLGPQFQENVIAFVKEYGKVVSNSARRKVWRVKITFDGDKPTVPLYMIEDDVELSQASALCRHCRVTGWGRHFVSRKKYLICIPWPRDWTLPNLPQQYESGNESTLSAIIHGNGFGHLIWIQRNKHLSGSEILNLWELLCRILQVRAVSLKDHAVIPGTDMKLWILNAAAYGSDQGWFFRQGYNKLVKVSYGVREEYEAAIRSLGDLSLGDVYSCIRVCNVDTYKKLRKIVCRLINLWVGAPQSFLIAAERRSSPLSFNGVLLIVLTCRHLSKEVSGVRRVSITDFLAREWNPAQVTKSVEDVAVVLMGRRGISMSREDLRSAALSLRVKNTGLVNHVIARMKNVVLEIGPMFYFIKWEKKQYSIKCIPNPSLLPPLMRIEQDIKFLYSDVLLPYLGQSKAVVFKAHLIKEFPLYEAANLQTFNCPVKPPWSDILDPGVLVSAAPNSSHTEVMKAAQGALRCTYIITHCVEVEAVNFDGRNMVLKGYHLEYDPSFRCEGGEHTPWIRCDCGAENDDGEKIVQCNRRLTWEHSHCNKVNPEAIVHLCSFCKNL